MAQTAQLLGEASEGDAHRIMIWGYPDGRMKIVWIWTNGIGHRHWHDAVYPLADIEVLWRIADACERGQPAEQANSPVLCQFPEAGGTRFRAPGWLLSRALNQISPVPRLHADNRRRAASKRTTSSPAVPG